MAGRHYVLDTNVLIDWWSEHYPPSVFPTLKSKLEALVEANRIHIIDQVWKEVNTFGHKDLSEWCADKKKLLHRKTDSRNLLLAADAIRKKYPSLIDANKNVTAADPYLIAYAKMHGSVLVTHETPRDQKNHPEREHYIPDVCHDMKVDWVRFLDLMTNEKWSF